MFSNIGAKIKKLALVLCWIGIGASVIGGIICFILAGQTRYGSGSLIASGFGAIIGGSLLSWLGSFFTYGFGELIETNQQIRDGLVGQPMPPMRPQPVQSAPYGGYAQPAPQQYAARQYAPQQPPAQRTHRAAFEPSGYNAQGSTQGYNQPRPAAQPVSPQPEVEQPAPQQPAPQQSATEEPYRPEA